MSCPRCVDTLRAAVEDIEASQDVRVTLGRVTASGVSRDELLETVRLSGFDVFHWRDVAVWKTAAYNTTFCLFGCFLGEYLTLLVYSYFELSVSTIGLPLYILLCILPVINGLATSIAFETILLVRSGMDVRQSFRTALGMSLMAMIIMEAAMELVDMGFTRGRLAINYACLPLMLALGYVTPLPYNYYRLKYYGKACH
tara:strand:- start:202 stop:798 length:597 start_codon:yes stop_codon:yes gene_type:complete